MAREKRINVDYSDFDEPVSRIEQKLSYYLESKDQEKLRIDEKYILADDQFQDAIREVRKELSVDEDYLEYEDDLDDWIVEHITGKPLSSVRKYSNEYHDALEKYNKLAWIATEKANLPYGWHEWVRIYIATDRPPQNITIEPDVDEKIEIIGIDSNSLIIRLNKGLRPNEYRSAWKAFSDFLRQPSEYRPRSDRLKNRIYLDRQKGLTYKEIADKYYPGDEDRFMAYDKVKKIIKRFDS